MSRPTVRARPTVRPTDGSAMRPAPQAARSTMRPTMRSTMRPTMRPAMRPTAHATVRAERAPHDARDQRPLLEHLQDYAAFVLANLLWLLGSLPLVSLPAATAGLSAVMDEWVGQRRRPPVVETFFGAARRQFGRATVVVLTTAAIALPLVLDLLIVRRSAEPGPLLLAARGLSLAGLAFLAAVNLVLWPSLDSGRPLGVLARRAAKVVLLRPLPSLLTLGGTALALALALFLPRAVFLFAGPACAALLACWGVSRIERRLPAALSRETVAGGPAEHEPHRSRPLFDDEARRAEEGAP